jgi:hypothetical protein
MGILIKGKRFAGLLRLEGTLTFPGYTETCAIGTLFNDEKGRFPDFSEIRTSLVKGVVIYNGRLVILTMNSAYEISNTDIGTLPPKAFLDSPELMDLYKSLEIIEEGVDHNKIGYPSTGQLRTVIQNVKNVLTFDGLDENGNVKRKTDVDLRVEYQGTYKGHGTNASIVQFEDGHINFQSKNRVLALGEDNNGFMARFSRDMAMIDDLFEYATELAKRAGIPIEYPIEIAGEYMGEGIQKGVAVSEITPIFAIFGVAFGIDQSGLKWVPQDTMKFLRHHEANIYNILDFGSETITIDFNRPELSQNDLIERTSVVETECPIGRYFDVIGVGEGIVWKPTDPKLVRDSGLWFKVKGEKHSVTKVKTLAAIDVVKVANIDKFVEYAVTENRLRQGLGEVFPDGKLDQKRIGDFIRWVNTDVIKEELDTIDANGLTMKDVGGSISRKAKEWLFAQMDEAAFQNE